MRSISDPEELKILSLLKQKRGTNPENKEKTVRIQLSNYKGLYAELRGERLRYFLRYPKANGKKTDRVYKGLSLKQITSSAYKDDLTLLEQKQDPLEKERKARQQAINFANENRKQKITFKQVYLQWKSEQIKETLNKNDKTTPKGKSRIHSKISDLGRIENHILSALANKPIYSINSYHLTEIFKPLSSRHTATAKKCKTELINLFSWYENRTKGDFKSPITYSFNTNLSNFIRTVVKKNNNYNAPDYRALPVIFSLLNSKQYKRSTAAKVASFCILTSCRSEAVRNLKWDSVHLNDDCTGYFIIPIDDNKVKSAPKELRTVYFGSMVGAYLESIKEELIGTAFSHKYVFPNRYRKDWTTNPVPLGENAISSFMRKSFHVNELKKGRLWKDMDDEKDGLIQTHATSRACFQTWALEQKDPITGLPRYSKELTEACLLHAKDDKYKGAYDRSRVPDEELYRIKSDWEDFVLSYELARLEILPLLDNPIASEDLQDHETAIQRLEKQGKSIEEQEKEDIQCLEDEIKDIQKEGVGANLSEKIRELRDRQEAIRRRFHIIKTHRIYECGIMALAKAQDDFKKYGGEELLRKLEEQKANGK